MDPNTAIDTLRRRGVARVCPACGMREEGDVLQVDLGEPFVGLTCAHCGHLRLFRQAVLDAPHP
jgi:predicted RNA-binding Zn-ribbon protein involved in translation (DUF1610 family)